MNYIGRCFGHRISHARAYQVWRTLYTRFQSFRGGTQLESVVETVINMSYMYILLKIKTNEKMFIC